MKQFFKPQIISVLKEGYTWQQFVSDLIAGIITGIVAIPLAIAFGIASGVTPQAGLYTAIIAGFLISLFSGSRVQIGGPTGAFIVIVYGVVSKFGMDGLLVATLMAGVILIAMGFFRFGAIIKYIPYPVTLGFTSGIAVLIATTQLKDALGLKIEKVPAEFVDKLVEYCQHLGTLHPWTIVITCFSIFIVFLTPKFSRMIPGSLLAIVFGTLIVNCFHLPVETIGSQFKEIKMGLPTFAPPTITFHLVKDLIPSAVAIAMLGAIESLLSAVVADGMIGTRHRSNTELIAQGIANLVTPFFGGIPATGAIARTATNVKNGGRTPFAGIIHAIVLLIAVICLGQMVSMIPMAVLGGLLLVVALNMSEYRFFIRMFKAPKSDIVVMLATFALTVLLDLTIAIPIGMIMASFLFMRRMEQTFGADVVHSLRPISKTDPGEDPEALAVYEVPDGVLIYEINGPFFFGAASKFQSVIQDNMPIVLIIRMAHVPLMDATGMNAFEEVVHRAQKKKSNILIAGIQAPVLSVLRKFGIIDEIGEQNIYPTLVEALPRSADIVQEVLLARAESRRTRSQSRIIKKIVSPPVSVDNKTVAVSPTLVEEIRMHTAHHTPILMPPHAIVNPEMDSTLYVGQDHEELTETASQVSDSIIIMKQEPQEESELTIVSTPPLEGVLDVEQVSNATNSHETTLPQETSGEISISMIPAPTQESDAESEVSKGDDTEDVDMDPVIREIRKAVIDEAIQSTVTDAALSLPQAPE